MRFTDPCDNCDKKTGKCKLLVCEDKEEYYTCLDYQWLKQLKN